ncbi:ABC transporter ATP-binding protein, partial [Caulobacter sp. 17J65-9]|uniref:ATP-binding cassette domain-containing protein n=1 Tax=Caulobacter sp. 17J65-9 TaxID=2709382 RepID=UPI0013C61AEF
VRRLARQTAGLRSAALGRARAAGRMRAVSQLTMGLASFAVLAVGALEVTGGRTTPGSVVAAMSLMGLLTPAVHGCGRVFELWHAARVCREKIAGLLSLGPLVAQTRRARPLTPGRGELVFQKVSARKAVRRLSARVPAGSVVALVGPNGAGKSTLLALATRLMDPDSGRVRLDGRDLRRVTTRSLRSAVALVGADVPLLRGSLSENLRYRAPGVSREEVERVAALCGVDQLIARLPKGERFAVADRGRNLSLGERQRVLLARALLGRPRLLLLDEADANLDEPVAEAIAAALEGYPGTVLMVTQRPSWLARADFVWRLEGGRLVEVRAKGEVRGQALTKARAKVRTKASPVPASNVVPLAGAVEQ